jgi:AAA+ superfamily predicted ATPase
LKSYIFANRPIIYIDHFDFKAVDLMIKRIADASGHEISEFLSGVGELHFKSKKHLDIKSLETFLEAYTDGQSRRKGAILLLKNVHQELQENRKVRSLLRLIAGRTLSEYGADTGEPVQVVIVSPVLTIPLELERFITLVQFGTPGERDIRDILTRFQDEREISVPGEVIRDMALSLRGLSEVEINLVLERVFQEDTCDEKFKAKATRLILEEKRQIISKSGLLKIENPMGGNEVDRVAGLEHLQEYLETDRKIFDQLGKARDCGVDVPKGILIVGMPGCGKSLTAKLTAHKFNMPLICLDVGRLMGMYVGQSEENLRRALQTVEAAAPCVLWVDELEKAFSGMKSGGDGSELTTRMFGHFLTWMQEKQEAVYVIATANDISKLPPEFLRKGRFDEIFMVDLPTESERKRIFELHLETRVKEKDKLRLFDINAFAAKSKTDGFCGADIGAAVGNAFKRAFIAGKTLPDSKDVLAAIEATHSITQNIGAERMNEQRKLFGDKFQPASKK